MSVNAPTHFVQQYTTNVQMLLQQKGSRLRDTVSMGSYRGKAAKAVEQIGQVKAQRKTTRHSDTPLISTPADARWVYPTDFEWADLIDDQDKIRMLIDPQSPYAMNGAYAMGRAIDDIILQAFFATSKTGQDGTVSTTFPSGNIVAVNTGAASNVGLNVAKLRAAKKILIANQVDVDNDPLYVALTSAEHDALLNETQAISLDYNTRPVLVDGRINSFMGFNFVLVEFSASSVFDAAATLVNGSSQRLVPVWAKSGMHLGMWEDIQTRIDVRPDKSYATQVYVRGTFGATRVEEGKVVQILCA